jgi:hypothetical protein
VVGRVRIITSLWRSLAMIVPYPFFSSPNGQSRGLETV